LRRQRKKTYQKERKKIFETYPFFVAIRNLLSDSNSTNIGKEMFILRLLCGDSITLISVDVTAYAEKDGDFVDKNRKKESDEKLKMINVGIALFCSLAAICWRRQPML
jgi:hypothetical protein